MGLKEENPDFIDGWIQSRPGGLHGWSLQNRGFPQTRPDERAHCASPYGVARSVYTKPEDWVWASRMCKIAASLA
jgi:hypothetical protein